MELREEHLLGGWLFLSSSSSAGLLTVIVRLPFLSCLILSATYTAGTIRELPDVERAESHSSG